MIRSMLFSPRQYAQHAHQRRRPGRRRRDSGPEDAVSPQEKDAARILVRNALSLMGFSCQTVVRINALDSGLCQQDLEEIVPQGPTALMLPKTTSAQQIQQLDAAVSLAEQSHGMPLGKVQFIPLWRPLWAWKTPFHRPLPAAGSWGFSGRGGPDRRPALQAHQGREGN